MRAVGRSYGYCVSAGYSSFSNSSREPTSSDRIIRSISSNIDLAITTCCLSVSIRSLQERFNVSHSRMRIFKLFFALASALHLFSCTFWRVKTDTFSQVRCRTHYALFFQSSISFQEDNYYHNDGCLSMFF